MPTLRMFHGEGDDVLVEAEYRRDDGSATTVWLLYRFEGKRLVEAIGFPSEIQARSYSPTSCVGLVATRRNPSLDEPAACTDTRHEAGGCEA